MNFREVVLKLTRANHNYLEGFSDVEYAVLDQALGYLKVSKQVDFRTTWDDLPTEEWLSQSVEYQKIGPKDFPAAISIWVPA